MSSVKGPKNRYPLVLLCLHVLLFVYSLCSFFSKQAAAQPFFSFEFCAFYAGMLAVLAVYAVGWQQILKHLPLTVAFANKSVTVVWGIAWGVVFFGEKLNWAMVVGAVLVIAGTIIFSYADVRETPPADAGGGS